MVGGCMADDDWRISATLEPEAPTARVLRALHEHEAEDDLRRRLGDRVAVSGDRSHVFLYTGSGGEADEARNVLARVLAAHELRADVRVERWHPLEERWEDPEVPLPQTAAEREVEHRRLEAEETAESLKTGLAEWEVRVELASHADAVSFAERLRGEGDSVVRRWKFLLVGANDRDDAEALAKRIESEAPAGAAVQVEPGGGMVWQVTRGTPFAGSPFAVFGGLAG
jgi:hypothetical protein